MNICLCGAQAGYFHKPDCPWPCYRGTDSVMGAWLVAREVRRQRLAREALEEMQDGELAKALAA